MNEGLRNTKKGGRPRLSNAKTSVFSIPVSADELTELRRAEAIKWARGVLLRAMKRRNKGS